MTTNIQATVALGSDFWNDSCDLGELDEAIAEGAVGATSNPVIVATVVENNPNIYAELIDKLIVDNPSATEDTIAWLLICQVGQAAAGLLQPIYEESDGKKGRLSLQVNPKFYPSTESMIEHALILAGHAPNIAIKVPNTLPGLKVMEDLTARGISVNATVSFTVAQAIAAAESIERGLNRAEMIEIDIDTIKPHITLMVGRIDDHLRRTVERTKDRIDPEYLNWAGVAIFKRAYEIFLERKYRSTLLSAAFRCPIHWSELVGGKIVISIPYVWWKKFNALSIPIIKRIDKPVDRYILDGLENLSEFKRAFEPDGLTPEEFQYFGASAHTLSQFIVGYEGLLAIIRKRMLRIS